MKEFDEFLHEPSKETLFKFLDSHLGEMNTCDFKKEWESWPKTARHVFGIANSGGGAIIIGAEQKSDKTFDIRGIQKIVDKSDVEKGINNYLPSELSYKIHDFIYEDDDTYKKLKNKRFFAVIIEDKPLHIPFISDIDSDPKEKKRGDHIDQGTIYIRRGTNTVRSTFADLQTIIRRRIEALSNIEPFEFFESEDVPTEDSEKYGRMFYNLSVRNKEGMASECKVSIEFVGTHRHITAHWEDAQNPGYDKEFDESKIPLCQTMNIGFESKKFNVAVKYDGDEGFYVANPWYIYKYNERKNLQEWENNLKIDKKEVKLKVQIRCSSLRKRPVQTAMFILKNKGKCKEDIEIKFDPSSNA